MPAGFPLIFDIPSPPGSRKWRCEQEQGWGRGGRYLGKAAGPREPVTGRRRGCLSGPGVRRQRGTRAGPRPLSARSTAASSGTAPAAPARHKQQGGLLRGWLRLQHGRRGHSVPARPFPPHGMGAKRQQELLVALPPSLLPSL